MASNRHQVNAKSLERRVCRALGGERRGPNPGSDCVGTKWSVEVKRMKVLSLRADHLEQAKRQGDVDGKPWILVIAEHGATLDEALVIQPFLPWAEKEMGVA